MLLALYKKYKYKTLQYNTYFCSISTTGTSLYVKVCEFVSLYVSIFQKSPKASYHAGRWNLAWIQYIMQESLKSEDYLKNEEGLKNEEDLKN